MPSRKRIVFGSFVLVGAIWLFGGFWRFGESYWNLRLDSGLFGDEGREWVYSQVGSHGGEGAIRFLQASLDEELSDGGNDVVVAGIIQGIVNTGHPTAAQILSDLFRRFENGPPSDGRWVAIRAALGLQEIAGTDFDTEIPIKSPYQKFGVSTAAGTDIERERAEVAFRALRQEVGEKFPRHPI